MKNFEANLDGYVIPVRCYKCNEGCIHLEYGNAIFTFTRQQFCILAEVISETYGKLKIEKEVEHDESSECTQMLLM